MEEGGRDGVRGGSREGALGERRERRERGEKKRRVCAVVARATSGHLWLELAGFSGKGHHPHVVASKGQLDHRTPL